MGQVVVDDKHVPALLHEELADGGGCVGGDELQARRVTAAGHDDHRVFQGVVLPQVRNHFGNRCAALSDGAVDADHVRIALVDDGVHCDGRLAGLPVAEDQLTLAATDGQQGVDNLDAGLQRDSDRCAMHDRRGRAFDGQALHRLRRRQVVQRRARRGDHAAQQAAANGDIEHAAGAEGEVAGAQAFAVTQQDDADFVRIQVEDHAQQPVGELEQFV